MPRAWFGGVLRDSEVPHNTLPQRVSQPPQGTCGKELLSLLSVPRGAGPLASTVRTGIEMELGLHVAPTESWLFLRPLSPSPFTLPGHLAEHQRGNQVAPHSRRLEYKKKDAEILVHHILARLSHFCCLQISHVGEVGTLRRPQRGCTQAQQDGGRDQGIPAEKPAKMEKRISVCPHRPAIASALLSKSGDARKGHWSLAG